MYIFFCMLFLSSFRTGDSIICIYVLTRKYWEQEVPIWLADKMFLLHFKQLVIRLLHWRIKRCWRKFTFKEGSYCTCWNHWQQQTHSNIVFFLYGCHIVVIFFPYLDWYLSYEDNFFQEFPWNKVRNAGIKRNSFQIHSSFRSQYISLNMEILKARCASGENICNSCNVWPLYIPF